MARGSGTVTINIVGKADSLKRALGDADKELSDFQSKTKGLGSKLTSFGSKMTLGVTTPIIGGFALATKAAAEDEDAQAKLAKTLRNTVGASDAVVKSVEGYIGQAMKASTFSDDDLRPAFERLVRSTHDVTGANDLLKQAMDIAAATGKPLETVATALAKAHDGNVGALGRLGIATKDAQGKTLDFESAMDKASKTFGGSAANALETTSGRSKALNRDMGELVEQIGAALVPVLDRLVPIVQKVVDWFSSLSPKTQTLLLVVGGLAAAIGPLSTAIGALSTAMAFLAANPAVAIGLAIAAIAAGLIYAYQHSETFRDIVNGVFHAVESVVGDVIGFILDGVDKFLGGLATMAEAASHLPFVGSKFKGMAADIRDAQHSVQGLADDMHRLGEKVDGDTAKVDLFTGKLAYLNSAGVYQGTPIFSLPGGPVKARQHGGPVWPGQAFRVGEHGPETVMFGARGTVVPNGGGMGAVSITVNGALDPASVARQIQSLLLEEKRRSGALGLA